MIEEPNGDKTLIDLVKILWLWKWRILSLVFVASLLSACVSLLLPNYFKSTAVFYAASQDLAKPEPLGDTGRNIEYYGNDFDIDRLLTTAHSHKLKELLIDSFDLYSWYKVDRQANNAEHRVRQKLSKLMSIEKTKFGAISLSIESINPDKAFEMTSAATAFIDQSTSNVWKSSQGKLLETYDIKITKSDAKIAVINDSLMQLKKAYNIYDLTNQSEILLTQQAAIQSRQTSFSSKLSSSLIQNNPDSLAYYTNLKSANQSQLRNVNSSIAKFNEGFNPIATLERLQIQMTQQSAIDKERRDQLRASFNSPTSGIILVEEPEVAVYKSRPRRSLLVIGTAFLTFVLVSLFALLYSTYKDTDWSVS